MECCLCYFGFLWICEITVPLDSLIDPKSIFVSPTWLLTTERAQRCYGSLLNGPRQTHFINAFHFSVEPQLISVHCLLFKFEDGHLLTTARFVHTIRSSLKEAGIDDSNIVDTASGLERPRHRWWLESKTCGDQDPQ